MRKAEPVQINGDTIYQGLIAAFKYGKIGKYSNDCAKIWGKDNIDENSLKALKLLVAESNWSIDAAKCLYMPERTKEAKNLILNATKGKLPNFFIYAKDKDVDQVEQLNNSVVNRISTKIPDSKINFCKTISKFDYQMLMNQDVDFSVSSESPVVKSYDYWNARINAFVKDKPIKNQDMYKYKILRKKVVEETGKDINYIVNTLVAFLYTVRKTSAKKGLWDAFGDVIVKNLEKNLDGKGKVCQVCGKRFLLDRADRKYCGKQCFELNRREYLKNKKRESRENEVKRN